MSGPVGVIYCGTCGALNPRTNHYCSACGHQLVDAYHASEGLRIYLTPDPGAALVDIVDPGSDITVVETDEQLPTDFAKVHLGDGRIGYVRLREVEQVAGAVEADAQPREQRAGCISSTAVLAILALMLLTSTLVLITAFQSNDPNADFISVIACFTVVPFFMLVVGFYLYVRKREQEMLDDDEDLDGEPQPEHPRRTAESGSD